MSDWEQRWREEVDEMEALELTIAIADRIRLMQQNAAKALNAKGGRTSGAERRAQADADKARALELAEEIRRPGMSKSALAEIVSRRLAKEGIYKSPGTLRKFLVTE